MVHYDYQLVSIVSHTANLIHKKLMKHGTGTFIWIVYQDTNYLIRFVWMRRCNQLDYVYFASTLLNGNKTGFYRLIK